jgi:acetyl/propionyl-CoA carboxylase alpha subunit
MMKAKVNNKYDFVMDESVLSNDLNSIAVKKGKFHILKNAISYTAQVIKANHPEKNFVIKVNGNNYTVQLKDKYDELLEKLGMSSTASVKIKELKAPMPGLVVEVRVKEGDEVKKGDALVVLQAMKMENILKSPADVSIKKVHVKKEDAIEKNQIIVSFN